MLRTIPCFLASAILAGFSLNATAGGFYASVTTVTEPTPTTANAYDNASAFSGDGSTALVGAVYGITYFDATSITAVGRAYFYRPSGGAWSSIQEVDDPDNAIEDDFGQAVALSADGTVALVGSDAAVSGQVSAGKAYLYTYSGGSWAMTQEFDDPSPTANDHLGYTVALSSDGTVAAIGAIGVNGEGAVYVYTFSGGVWSAPVTIADPDAAINDFFGIPLKLSADGTAVLIGSRTGANGGLTIGKVYLYTLTSGIWSQSHEFDDPGAAISDFFGANLDISSNGTTVAISAGGSDFRSGKTYIYTGSGGAWSQTTITDPDDGGSDFFGGPLALSSDGATVLIRSSATVSGRNGTGKAYLYTLANGAWTKLHEFDDPADSADDFFGDGGVALTQDGQTAFITDINAPVAGVDDAGESFIYQTYVDLGLAASPGTVKVGQQSVLTATLTDESNNLPANNVSLSFPLPKGLSLVSESADGGSCTTSSLTVTCTLTSLASGATWQPTVTIKPSAAGSTQISVTGTASSLAQNSPDSTVTATIKASAPASSGSGGSSSSGGGSSSSGGGGDTYPLVLACLGLLLAFHRRRSNI